MSCGEEGQLQEGTSGCLSLDRARHLPNDVFAVVYLSSKLGQLAGMGLFGVIRDHYSRWVLYPALIGVLIGNTIEAGATG